MTDTSEHWNSYRIAQTIREAGIPAAVAAERLRGAARRLDLAEFEALLAADRPALWKRMNKRPARFARLLQRFAPGR